MTADANGSLYTYDAWNRLATKGTAMFGTSVRGAEARRLLQAYSDGTAMP